MDVTLDLIENASDIVRAALLGHAVGDALGVPVEFASRQERRRDPVKGMRAFGTHRQPAGTWSDDTSLTLCLAESLCDGYDLDDQAERFRRWYREAHWTPHGEVFDIGIATRQAIGRYREVPDVRDAGSRDVNSNGNGSLMRIMPLALWSACDPPGERVTAAMEASCLTHGHERSQFACAFFVDLVARLLHGADFPDALAETQHLIGTLIDEQFPEEMDAFILPLDPHLADRGEHEISGSGYVIHTLGASLWCCLNSGSYEEAALRAVNLGEDTDTTGAVTGGLAGLIFGLDAIPEHWQFQLARYDDIEQLCDRLAEACANHWKEAIGND